MITSNVKIKTNINFTSIRPVRSRRLTVVQVLQQVLLTREVQLDLDVDGQRHSLAQF